MGEDKVYKAVKNIFENIKDLIRISSRKIVHDDLSDNEKILLDKHISVLQRFYSISLNKD